jgi:glycerol kinase
VSGREHLLGLDLGTTSVRALVVRADGVVRARAQQPISTRYPRTGRVEQDPEEMWARSAEVLRGALAESGLEGRDLAALGLVTQRSTAIAWDAARGAALAPALGWQDRRTRQRVAELRSMGIPMNTMASATKFEWLLQEVEELRGAARTGRLRLGTPDAWLAARLTGGADVATDPGQASCTGLYDLARGRWHQPALELFGLEPSWLPRLAATCAIVGETPRGLLGSAVPLAARAGDQQAATFAHGVRRAGEAKLTLGTAAMLDVHAGAHPPRPPRGAYPVVLWELRDGDRSFGVEGTVQSAGAAVDWLVELGLLRSPQEVDRVAAADADGVAFVPALHGLGSPYLDEGARGLLGGLTRGSGRAQVVRAVLEGVAHRCVDVCEALGSLEGPLRVDGGLARSDVLVQTLSDLCGREVWRAAETETTGIGAAALAAAAIGLSDGDDWLARSAPARFLPRLAAPARSARRSAWGEIAARAASGGTTTGA